MSPISFNEYMEIIPEETKQYIQKLMYYLNHKVGVEVKGRYISKEMDKLLFQSLNVYQKISEENRSVIASLGFNAEQTYYDAQYEDPVEIFNRYYKFFVPYEKEEEFITATPEDIIRSIFLSSEFSQEDNQKTVSLINGNVSDLFVELRRVSEQKKKDIAEELEQKYFTSCKISTVYYLEMVSKIYSYLDDNRDTLFRIKHTDENLKALAYTLGLFYYENVASNKTIFDEKKIITDYLEKIGLTSEKLETLLGINIQKMYKNPSIVLLKSKLNIDLVDGLYDKSVGNIFYEMVNQTNKENPSFKQVFALCKLSSEDVLGYKTDLDTKRDENNGIPYTDIYNGVLSDTNKLFDRLCQVYSYISSFDNLNDCFIKSSKDYLVLSLLICNYLDNRPLALFLEDNGLSFDVLLEKLYLPKKEELLKNIDATKVDRNYITKFYYLVSEGMCKSVSKSDLSPGKIYSNLYNPDYSKSQLIHNLYLDTTEKVLPHAYKLQVDNNFNRREEIRINSIKERLFKDVSIDVYNYLLVVYSYYCIFKNKKLSDEDAEQLSIIFGACRYSEKINDCFEKNNVTRKKLSKFFDLDFSYTSSNLDIEELERVFGKYIFDREPSKITVNSILGNAFDPKLTNSVELRQALFSVDKKPEDFVDVDKLLEEYDSDIKERNKKAEIDRELDRFRNGTMSWIEDVLKVYNYLKKNVKPNEFLTSDNDYKEMALLIICLNDKVDSSKYLKMNNITLDYLLSIMGITEDDLEQAHNSEFKRELILDFKDYFSQASYVYVNSFKYYVFNDRNKLMRKIVKSLDEDYDTVRDSVINSKEKKVTPEEGISMLSKVEVLPIEGENISSIATYGSALSQHSKFINDSLHELMFKDTIDESIKDVNSALDDVVKEERVAVQQTFWESMFSTKPAVKVVKKYNPEKVGELQDAINTQLVTLSSELEGYEYIKKYIELYLLKLDAQLKELKRVEDSLDTTTGNMDDIESFTKALDNKTKKEILHSKISTIETMIVLMKQELLSVHRAIINHFITINSLYTSKNAILPVLASEMIINKGNKSEGEALELTNSLIGLLQSVVNKNVALTEQNLERLRLTSISAESFDALNKEISLYLEDVNRTSKLLEEPKEETYVQKIAKDTGLTLNEDVPNLTLEKKN